MLLFRLKLVLFTLSSCAHLVATGVALLTSFGVSMDRFDSGRAPTIFESVIGTVFSILSFPTIPLVNHSGIRFPGLWGYLPFVVNSALWGFVICLLVTLLRKKKRPNQLLEPTTTSVTSRADARSAPATVVADH